MDPTLLAAQTSPLTEQRFKLPLRIAGQAGATRDFDLDVLLVRPAGAGPFPLAVITHGTARDAPMRKKVRTDWFLAAARSFARRGWATAIVVRRSFGDSTGAFEEGFGTCEDPNFVHAAQEAAKDLAGTVSYLTRLPFVDRTRVLGIGHSTGGLAWLAAAAHRVPGLVAIVNFAGGTGSSAPGRNCSEPRLLSALAGFGAGPKTPSLWIYAENDFYFGLDLAKRMLSAYRTSGGQAELHVVPPHGADGHDLFLDPAAAEIWSPLVDQFLRALGLPTWTVDHGMIDALVGPHKDHFLRYLTAASEKAFAISEDGSWDWWVGPRNSTQDAVRDALEKCQQDGKRKCSTYAVNFSKFAIPDKP
jgi:dienelactone hydrolase